MGSILENASLKISLGWEKYRPIQKTVTIMLPECPDHWPTLWSLGFSIFPVVQANSLSLSFVLVFDAWFCFSENLTDPSSLATDLFPFGCQHFWDDWSKCLWWTEWEAKVLHFFLDLGYWCNKHIALIANRPFKALKLHPKPHSALHKHILLMSPKHFNYECASCQQAHLHSACKIVSGFLALADTSHRRPHPGSVPCVWCSSCVRTGPTSAFLNADA